METQVRTPQSIFMQPQRLVVPLFQRPYVWNEDDQWEPLWGDVVRVAERVLANPHDKQQPHFLGAIVVQQIQNQMGTMQERTVIDGQQRLTTLQLLLDALHAELVGVGALQPAKRIESLVVNDEAYWEQQDDGLKVRPTTKDLPSFHEVMAARPPVAYEQLQHRDSRLVQAHKFFGTSARDWLMAGAEEPAVRAAALERAVRELMQLVVIDLTAEENAQEIFETLNARGAVLTAADLIKNFIFQRLSESGADVQAAYEKHWKDFETGFWEAEISAGRVKHQRSSMFLNQWLISRTGQEILAREVFQRFKRYADFESGLSMPELLAQVHRASLVYREFVDRAGQLTGPIDRLGLFAYRSGVLESEVIKPFVLFLLDPDESPVPADQVQKALGVVESWMVRRMLVRATSKSYTQLVGELITHVRAQGREQAGDLVQKYLAGQAGANRYWPADSEVRDELATLAAYRRLSRARVRMVLEGVEDHRRGWRDNTSGLGGERVARGSYAIEHILPRKWQQHWPLTSGISAAEREALVDTLGNLTLLTGKLNSKVSNGPWLGDGGKRAALEAHDVLMLNRHLRDTGRDGWDEATIEARGESLVDDLLEVWPVPEGHRPVVERPAKRPMRQANVADLITAGLLTEGTLLYAKRKRVEGRTATVLHDGALDVDGVRHATPSGAARAVSGTAENGWAFWLVDPSSRRSLLHVFRDYREQRDIDMSDEQAVADDDD
ncbi:DUF262 domain-containing protein [Blastococcus sp. LR1]|uniref:GmrSD restriction endonuclease domain-containing protein n=1 Tax=Blastococcus sp. LR1 TaxID=2877000 RepID=UPI001CCA865E|nr:DUF262 domain-containing protein [Blastococcus sp. LR1]MCA0146755.1 DUF262 domain-containing protein [Blastococcus sp. LR1]